MLIRSMLCAFLFIYFIQCPAQNKKAVSVIFDSDMGPDYDDVGAITLLHAFADSGYIDIAATIASTRYEGVAAVFNVFNTYFNEPDLPIGVPKKGVDRKDWQHWTDTLIARYPHHITLNSEVPDAVEVYRKVLSSLPDHSVVIITVGFFTNLSDLLQSGPDRFSKLKGRQLIQKKVKQLVSMAGKFPKGKEFNVELDASAAQYVANNWPTPILFSGVEIGEKIKTGLPLVNETTIVNSPVKDVFRICLPMAKEDNEGRKSWDETAVLVAVKGYQPFYTIEAGKMMVEDDGTNSWSLKGTKQRYLKEKAPPKEVEQLINKIMMHQPRQAGTN